MTTPRPLAALVIAALGLAACSSAPQRTVRLGDHTIDPAQLTAGDVAREVTVTARGEDTIYRAPTMSAYREVDVSRGGPAFGANLGTVKSGRQGFLFGVRKGSGPLRTYAAFQSSLIVGTGRYVSVTLADGTPLPIRTARNNAARCEPDCALVFETVVVEIPDAALRTAAADGLAIDYHLDKGPITRATAPASYVRGYLEAVEAPR